MATGFRIELERRRSLAEMIAATVELHRRYPLLFAVLAVAVMGPYELAVLAITGDGPLRHGHEGFAASLSALTLALLYFDLRARRLNHSVKRRANISTSGISIDRRSRSAVFWTLADDQQPGVRHGALDHAAKQVARVSRCICCRRGRSRTTPLPGI